MKKSFHIWIKIFLTVLLGIAVFILDYSTELGVAGGVPYVALVLMALWYKDKKISIILGITGLVLTALGYYLSPEGGELWKVILNRIYAFFVISVVTIFVYQQKSIQQRIKSFNRILEQRVAERTTELERANKELKGFASVASHDLKAPLSNIQSLIMLIDQSDGINENSKYIFEKLKTSVEQTLATLLSLNEVLALKDTFNVENERLSFDEVLNTVTRSIEVQIKSSNATINADFSECGHVYYPPLHLQSIMLNLLTNAIKFKKQNTDPVIQIKTAITDGKTCLMIKDNGLGFDVRKHKDKVFGLFKRLHTHVEGQGVGLYIIKLIVDSHNGKIDVISEPNKSTTFKIYFNNERS
ncbi:MAG: HAMP domain-containing histidine kinase [Chlorobi bacterium]|nr:HAMP domain-containing histidine kinase [Chlorobiota bacterium]